MALPKLISLIATLWLLAALLPSSLAACTPSVTPSAVDVQALLNPPKTAVTFWSAGSVTAQIVATLPTSLPLQLQVLADVNGQSVAQATRLVEVLKEVNSFSDLFGAGLGPNSAVAVRLYTETSSPGPVLQLGGASTFQTNVTHMVEDLAISYLLASEQPEASPTSTRLLELATEILTSWPQTQSTSSYAQVLLVVAPNAFPITPEQWTNFTAAVRMSRVLPLFYAPNADASWQSEFSSAWISAFPSSTVPALFGSETAATAWNNFNLASAINFARSLIYDHPLILFSDDANVATPVVSRTPPSTLTVDISVTLPPLATPFSKPTLSEVGVLGLRPVTVETSFAQSPSGTNADATLQRQSHTRLLIPVSHDVTSVSILTLPTQGKLFANTSEITSTPFLTSPTDLYYLPNFNHGDLDSIQYYAVIPCGNWGPFTLHLNLSFVPLTPTALNGSLQITEGDASVNTVDLKALVGNLSPSATITLLSLPNMAGWLNLTSTNTVAQLSTAYPVDDAVFQFKLYRMKRGPRTVVLKYLVDNGLGATANGEFTIQVDDVQYPPEVLSTATTSAFGRNFLTLRDYDNDTVTALVAATGSGTLEVCHWVDSTSNCQTLVSPNSVTFTNLQTPAILSVAKTDPALLLVTSLDYTVTLTDATAQSSGALTFTANESSLIDLGSLLGGLLGLVGNVVTGLTTILTLDPNNPSSTSVLQCSFPLQPAQASLKHNGIEASGIAWDWSTSEHTAAYTVFEGVSGRDDVSFQCTYQTTLTAQLHTGPISRWSFTIPITTPKATSLTLTPAPDALFTFLPIQGLISEGGLSLVDITPSGGTAEVVDGGIKFIATQTVASLSYRLCSTINSTLCSDIISNVINTIQSLPILGAPSQRFTARLNNTLNTFSLTLPTPIDGIEIQSVSLLNMGTLKINDVAITTASVGSFFSVPLTVTYEVSGDLPITAQLLSLYSFSFTAVNGGKHSQPGSVFILPDPLDLVPLIPSLVESVNDLVSNLDTTLATSMTLIPGFRVEIDLFGKKQAENSYAQLEASVSSPSKRDESALVITATWPLPEVGQVELCENEVCQVIDLSTTTVLTVRYNQSVFYTPPLLSTLYSRLGPLQWTVKVADTLLRFTEVTLNGALSLANDVLSDTLRINVLGNTSPALRLGVPGVKKLLIGAGLDPDGCGGIPPSPMVCVNGELVSNGSVVVQEVWQLSAGATNVQNGDFSLTSTGVLHLNYVPTSGSRLPFINVTGDVVMEGEIKVSLSNAQLYELIFGSKRDSMETLANGTAESQPKTVVEGKSVRSNSTIELLTENNACFGATLLPGNNGRPTLTVAFSFNGDLDGCSNLQQTPDESRNVPAIRRRNRIIWITCAVVGGCILIALVIVTLVFRFNRSAKQTSRPYSVRRAKGHTYRTQPSSEMQSGSAGSAEAMSSDLENPSPYGTSELIPDEISDSNDSEVGNSGSDDDDSIVEDFGETEDLAETQDNEMPQSYSGSSFAKPSDL